MGMRCWRRPCGPFSNGVVSNETETWRSTASKASEKFVAKNLRDALGAAANANQKVADAVDHATTIGATLEMMVVNSRRDEGVTATRVADVVARERAAAQVSRLRISMPSSPATKVNS